MTGAIHGAETAHPSGAPEFYLILFTCLGGVRVVFVVKLHVFTIFVTFCVVRYEFRVLNPICFVWG